MSDKINIELDESFIKKFFSVTDTLAPNMSEVNLSVLKKQLFDIEQLLNAQHEELEKFKVKKSGLSHPRTKPKDEYTRDDIPTGHSTQAPSPQPDMQQEIPIQFIVPPSQSIYDEDKDTRGKVLIIDDLGVITYQLGVIFKKLGYEVTASKEIYEAIEKFKRNIFNFVVMDLFIPTEREGFILLDELKKISNNRQQSTVIGVMSASTRKEHKILCANKGAEFYVEKVDDWQKELFKIFESLKSRIR